MFTFLFIANLLVLLCCAAVDMYNSVESLKKYSPEDPISRTAIFVHSIVRPFKQRTRRA